MKKIINYLLLAMVSITLLSCGGGIKPADPPITYYDFSHWSNYEKWIDIPVRDCFEVQKVSALIVPDDEYPNLYSNIKATVIVKTLKSPATAGRDYSSNCRIQILDKDGAVIAETGWGIDGRQALFTSKEGDVITLSAELGDKWNKETAEEMFKKVKYIRLAEVGCGYKAKTDTSYFE